MWITEPKQRPTVEVKPTTTNTARTNPNHEPDPQSSSITEDIDEEIDEFLNSSISASDDFSKEETATDDASLKADYVENL